MIVKGNFADTNIGFGTLYYMFLCNKKEGEKVFDLPRIYWRLTEILNDLGLNGYSPSKNKDREILIRDITKRHDDRWFKNKPGETMRKDNKDIESEEEAELFDKLVEEYSDENGWLDADLIESRVRDEFPEIVGLFIVSARGKKTGLFRDAHL